MGYAKIKGELTSRIGRPVKNRAPKDVQNLGGRPVYGKIVDEVWADQQVNKRPPRPRSNKDDWGDYSFCAQLIKLSQGGYEIRLAYYRRRAGEDWWEYASQTTVSGDWNTMKALLEATLAKKNWFKDNPEE